MRNKSAKVINDFV